MALSGLTIRGPLGNMQDGRGISGWNLDGPQRPRDTPIVGVIRLMFKFCNLLVRYDECYLHHPIE